MSDTATLPTEKHDDKEKLGDEGSTAALFELAEREGMKPIFLAKVK